MSLISDIFSIDVKKTHIRNFWFYTIVFISAVSPGYLIIYLYFNDIFLSLDFMKLFILSLSLFLPVYLFNVFLYYVPLKDGLKKLEELISEAEIASSEKEIMIELKRGKLREENLWKHILFEGSFINSLLFYGALILKFNEPFLAFIKYLVFLEIIFAISSTGVLLRRILKEKYKKIKFLWYSNIVLFIIILIYIYYSSHVVDFIFKVVGFQ